METLQARNETVIKNDIHAAIHHAMRIGENDTVEVILTEDPIAVNLTQSMNVDWNKYRGAYKGWACNYRTHSFTVPVDWCARVQSRGLAIVDGMLTLDAAPIDGAPEGVDLFAAAWVIQGRGNSAQCKRGYIARVYGVAAYKYHADTADAALRGLRRKIRALGAAALWDAQLRTADLSQLIVGHEGLIIKLSDARAIGACEYGIRSWCYAVGLPYEVGAAPLSRVYGGYMAQPHPEARAAILHALRRVRATVRAVETMGGVL